MRRTLPYVALWLAAGALAAAVATAGVSVVNDQLTSPRPAPLSAEEVRREVAAAAATSTTASDGPTATTTTPRATATTTTTSEPPAGGDDGPPPTAPTATTTVAAPAPVTKTYDLVGGTATLRFSASGVTVLAASPAPGFTVDIGDSHSGGKRVEFESDDHRSRLDAWWDAGPEDEVREEA